MQFCFLPRRSVAVALYENFLNVITNGLSQRFFSFFLPFYVVPRSIQKENGKKKCITKNMIIKTKMNTRIHNKCKMHWKMSGLEGKTMKNTFQWNYEWNLHLKCNVVYIKAFWCRCCSRWINKYEVCTTALQQCIILFRVLCVWLFVNFFFSLLL